MAKDGEPKRYTRRDFLRKSTLLAAGVTLAPIVNNPAATDEIESGVLKTELLNIVNEVQREKGVPKVLYKASRLRSNELESEILPKRIVEYKVIVLPEGISSNVSFIDINIDGSPVEAADKVLKLGGADVNSGTEAAVITIGSNSQTGNRAYLEVYGPGQSAIALQDRCESGIEPKNDMVKVVLVATPNITDDTRIVLWENDENGVGTGANFVIDGEMLKNSPSVELLAVKLPDAQTANRMSWMTSCTQDVLTPVLGPYSNFGQAVVGVKDGEMHGMMLPSGINDAGTLESCLKDTNDMNRLWVIETRKMANESRGLNLLTLSQDDLDGIPTGEKYSLDLTEDQFTSVAAHKYNLPLVMN